MTSKLDIVLVTGANAGLGFETCRQLASDHGVKTVVMACRNAKKAQAAIEKLVKETGKPSSTFKFLQMDASDLASCRDAVDNLDVNLDGVVMNAGGPADTNGHEIGPNGTTQIFQINVLGHAVFIEKLIASGKLNKNARTVLSGSETARGVPEFGLAAAVYESHTADCISTHIDGSYFDGKYDKNVAYSFVKSIGALYMGALARKNPDYVLVTMSPGVTAGTDIMKDMPWYQRVPMSIIAPLMMGNVKTGAGRYVSVLLEAETLGDAPSGKFFASPKGKVHGKEVVDQVVICDDYANEELQDAAFEAIHRFIPSS